MKRRYADLHLCPDSRDEKQLSKMLGRALEFDYRMVAVPTSISNDREETDRLHRVGKDVGIDVVTRLDLRPKSCGDLIRSLRKLRRKYELIAVICDSKPVARQAAKDRRVDLLNFVGYGYRQRYFDLSEAELASNALAGFEVDIKPLLMTGGSIRTGLLMSLRREVAIARSFNVPVVVSSGVSDVDLMREPNALVALSSLFDLDHTLALNAVSDIPQGMVKRNREKLCSRYVSPGISIVREGKDC